MLKQFFQFLLVLCGALALASAGRYDGYKVYEIKAKNLAGRKALRALASEVSDKYEFLTLGRNFNGSASVLVSPENEAALKAVLEKQQISHTLQNSNFGRTLQDEVLQHRMLHQSKPYAAGTGRLGTERYHTHSEINAYLDDLAARYPSRVYVKIVGKSYEGRLLKTITITNGDGRAGKNVIFIDGGFHANEWISPATVVFSIGELVENFEEHAELLNDYDWIVLPVVNPDGYEYTQLSSETRLWRKTRQPVTLSNGTVCYGTDPNRNFDFHWLEKGASSDPCSNFYAGPRPFSEPETVVVRDILHTLRGRGILYLSLHSYGSAFYYPWGWGPVLPDTWEDLHEVGVVGAEAIHAYNGTEYEVGSSTALYGEACGASDDYAFNDGFALTYTMELPFAGSSGFEPPASDIDRLVRETWAGIRAVGKRVTVKYPLGRKRGR
ncbi:carboxypeptidase B-like [Rhagoletis pomonella]|uniref:carboxypeptidase B-like n=1 Tax=Rhagoletis pomonella TaxID=28610 RepID=UPI00177C4B13|nr:carboxypeptidase B-like [Rhagoletis pomonella]